MRIAVDLDDTINHSKQPAAEYGNEVLQDGAIETLRQWKREGHYIIINTARHMKTCKNNAAKALARQGLTTLQWLEDNKVPYDELWWSKPDVDIFIDDKGFKHTPGNWDATRQAVYKLENDPIKVWVNGCFDVLHLGHIKLLEHASMMGPLRVGLDSDSKVRTDKGEDRPFNSFETRREMLKALKFGIDNVMTYDTNKELEQHIADYEPHVIVVGEEHMGKVVGADYAWEIEYFERYENHSTTRILT